MLCVISCDPPYVEVAFMGYNDIRCKLLALSRTMMHFLVFICCKIREKSSIFCETNFLLALLNFSKWFILFKFSDLSLKSQFRTIDSLIWCGTPCRSGIYGLQWYTIETFSLIKNDDELRSFIGCKLRLRYSNVYHGVCGGSFEITFTVPETKGELQKFYRKKIIIKKKKFDTVKPLITNKSKEFIKCRILYFLIMECCRYLVFFFI